MQNEAEFRRAIENSPTAWVRDSSGNITTLTGKEVRENNLNSVIRSDRPVQVYKTDEGWSTNIKDPFIRAGKEIDSTIAIDAPKIKVVDNTVKLQAPKEILSSPIAAQMKEEMKSLVGADLSAPEVQNAINA